MKVIETDFAIVGSGPGGAGVARELAKAGKKVAILEKGRRHHITRNKFNRIRMHDKFAVFSRSEEGVIIDRAITLGGCSMVFCGNAFDPPGWLGEKIGIDLKDTADEIKEEVGIKPFSDKFTEPWVGTAGLRKAAAEQGIDLKWQSKFIREDLCKNDCDECMTGCKDNAKWTAREWVDEAVSNGAVLVTEADVTEVIIENKKAKGVRARTREGEIEVKADSVVVSAGGIGTGVLLQRSGLENAGGNFYMDPMNVLWGMMDKPYNDKSEMTFSCACEDFADERGYILGNVSGKGAWLSQLFRPTTGWRVLGAVGKWDRMIGMFIKIGDSAEGRVEKDGRMKKPFNEDDRRRAHEATELCRNIMTGAGVNPDTILVAEYIGGHPGGTAAVGRVVDKDLQVMGVENLFVCDASIFPRSPGRPPTLMIMALARNFGKKLAAN
jgi:choline dehydrogenase-like flavoprotein